MEEHFFKVTVLNTETLISNAREFQFFHILTNPSSHSGGCVMYHYSFNFYLSGN